MVKKELMIIDYSQETLLSLDELCDICGIHRHFIDDLIEYDIIHPLGNIPEEWRFNLTQLQRVKRVQRVQRDLEINMAGAALMLELVDEIEKLRAKAELLDKYFYHIK